MTLAVIGWRRRGNLALCQTVINLYKRVPQVGLLSRHCPVYFVHAAWTDRPQMVLYNETDAIYILQSADYTKRPVLASN